ncbi:MAG: hypothetical protein SU899_04370 [Chloroflexota bacterium]|nr:hypothetical protein [Chloroflexota bacterium]
MYTSCKTLSRHRSFYLANPVLAVLFIWDSSTEYGLPDPESEAKNAKRTKIDSLGLQVKNRFLYLFDFEVEWWHSIELLSIKEEEHMGKPHRIVESKGEAPLQYPPSEE